MEQQKPLPKLRGPRKLKRLEYEPRAIDEELPWWRSRRCMMCLRFTPSYSPGGEK